MTVSEPSGSTQGAAAAATTAADLPSPEPETGQWEAMFAKMDELRQQMKPGSQSSSPKPAPSPDELALL